MTPESRSPREQDAKFDHAVAFVLEHEVPEGSDGWADHPADRGGLTRWGISSRWHPDIDLEALTREGAVAVYRTRYWDRWGYGRLFNKQVAAKLLDMTVNIGPRRSHLNAQRACRACGEPVKEDGILGPITRDRLNVLAGYELMPAMRSEHAAHYRELVVRAPDQAVFMATWMDRAYA